MLDAETQTTQRIDWLRQRINEADTLATVYRIDLAPQAAELLTFAVEEYTGRRLPAVDVLAAVESSLAAESDAIRYQRELGEALAEWQSVLGYGMGL